MHEFLPNCGKNYNRNLELGSDFDDWIILYYVANATDPVTGEVV